jgi:hypothetical protein
MTTQYNSRGNGLGTFFAFLIALVLGAVAFVLFLRHATTGMMGNLADRIIGRTTVVEPSVPIVVQRIQKLSRLETVVYSLDTIVEGSRSSAVLPDLLAGDRILLVVHGQSIAGIDLGQLKPEDVRITNQGNGTRSIKVTLPGSQLFSTSLDNQHRPAGSGRPEPGDRDPRQGRAAAAAGRAQGRHPRRRHQKREGLRHHPPLRPGLPTGGSELKVTELLQQRICQRRPTCAIILA